MSSTSKVPSASITLDRRQTSDTSRAGIRGTCQTLGVLLPWGSWLETTCWRLFWVKEHPHEHQGLRFPTTPLFCSHDRCHSFHPSVVLMWLVGVWRTFICRCSGLRAQWTSRPCSILEEATVTGEEGMESLWHQERKLVPEWGRHEHLPVALLCGARHTWVLVEVSWGFEGTGFKMGYEVFDFCLESVCRHVCVPAHLSSSGSLFPSACFIPLFSHTLFFLLHKHRVS